MTPAAMQRLCWRVPEMREVQSGTSSMVKIGDALHDLCQPLTVLQCKLTLSILHGQSTASRETVEEALHECARLNETVHRMRTLVELAMRDESSQRMGRAQ